MKEERFQIFLANLKDIKSLNEKSSNAIFGITKFTDLTKDEFIQTYTGLKENKNLLNRSYGKQVPKQFNYTAPDNLDWRTQGVVSRVKDQGTCVSCWAFGVTGNVESINAVKSGSIVEISEQQLVDCAKNSQGCSGGMPDFGLSYLVKNGTRSSESYPYEGKDGSYRFDNNKVVTHVTKTQHFKIREQDMKEKLYKIGPLSIAMDFTVLQFYIRGIIIEGCSPVDQVNHAVLLVWTRYGQVSPSRLVMLFFIFYLIVGISAAPERQVYSQDEGLTLFEQFIEEHNKQYDHEEKEERFKIFLDNLKEINDHNERSSHATFGITQFSDLTNEEFVKRYTGYKSESNSSLKKFRTTAVPESFNYTVPDEFDWRSKGVVSRVKNQHQCGSCWAFSTTGNVESINAIKSGNIVEISEQQLVDCDDASSGCNGGNQVSALDYLVQNGAMSSQSYPYQAQDGTCSYNSQSVVIKLRHFEYLRLDEEDMKKNLYSTGPASIGLAAIPLKHYNGGILVDKCSDPQVNHAVLLVGYGQENGVPFWLIKNSWGTSWGEDGYFRIKRGVDCLHLTRQGISRAIL